jgi:hypothetical protein
MTRRPTTKVVAKPTSIDWKTTFARMEIGDKLLIHDMPQTSVGRSCATWSKDGKRFVTRKVKDGIYAIRVA